MHITVALIAQLVDGHIEGDAQRTISGPARIEEGTEGTISFLDNPKYEHFAYTTNASALLVHTDFQPKHALAATLIRVSDVRKAVALLLGHFDQSKGTNHVVQPQAFVHESARLGANVGIGRFTVVENDVTIGEDTVIHDQVYIGPGVVIGARCTLWPGVKIYRECVLGDDCIIHSNTVIGADGFGFVPQPDGSFTKVPQVGIVRLGNKVEIGANCAIDRATMGETVIEDGVKLDNLIHVAHNVRIGAHTVLAAQVGIAGSTRLGKHIQLGGQVGVAGHLEIADRTRVQAQSGIASNIEEPDQAYFGSPAIDYKQYIRSYAVFKQLPDLDKRLRRLERLLDE